MKLNELRHIYFLGIGGIGMSALARYFMGRGIRISGYDKTQSELTNQLQNEGMKIHFEDKPSALPEDIDLVVLTPAIPKDHNEWKTLREKGIPIMKRAEVLGMISKDGVCLCVAGTHGKTTTTTLLTHLLRSSDVACTAFLGGIAGNYSSNYVAGNGELIVMEADEYDRSFLQLSRDGVIITAVDPDHLDIYGTAENMLEAYSEFAGGMKSGGTLVIRDGLPLRISENLQNNVHVETYAGNAGNRAENIRIENGFFVFDYVGKQMQIKNLVFAMPGRHNIENACAAITLSLRYGATEEGIRKGLKDFKGIQRRFDFAIRDQHQVLIDDYAHHPVELRAAISAAKELFKGKKITGLFQPHLFSRTRDFLTEFAESLSLLDELVLLDIYPARELPIEGITSAVLLDKVNLNKKELLSKEEAVRALINRKPEVLMVLGAGDVDRLVEPIKTGLLKN